jgi:predicted nucleic acid-binding protein
MREIENGQSRRQRLLLDSSPLITLALFPIHRPALEVILTIADITIVETVANEVTVNQKHRDAVLISELIRSNRIEIRPVPVTAHDTLLDAYPKVDPGERNTIRCALTMPESHLVLDDMFAFITATHFGLKPTMLLDLLAQWGEINYLSRIRALGIVNAIASRYSEAFVNHTREKLREV